MQPWRRWLEVALLLGFCGCGGAILFPIFASAKVAAQRSKEWKDLESFRSALTDYVESHQGRLPASGWKKTIARDDPRLGGFLERNDDGWSVGYAAVPGTLGKKLGDLPPEAILFVEYRDAHPVDILKDVSTVGDLRTEGVAHFVTAEDVTNHRPYRSRASTSRIGWMLGRQRAPGLE